MVFIRSRSVRLHYYAAGSKYRRQQVLLDTHTLLQRIKALDIPSLPQDLGGLTLDTMKEFSK